VLALDRGRTPDGGGATARGTKSANVRVDIIHTGHGWQHGFPVNADGMSRGHDVLNEPGRSVRTHDGHRLPLV
jgi:hypothetical protein